MHQIAISADVTLLLVPAIVPATLYDVDFLLVIITGIPAVYLLPLTPY